jgi:hypothetical protein
VVTNETRPSSSYSLKCTTEATDMAFCTSIKVEHWHEFYVESLANLSMLITFDEKKLQFWMHASTLMYLYWHLTKSIISE